MMAFQLVYPIFCRFNIRFHESNKAPHLRNHFCHTLGEGLTRGGSFCSKGRGLLERGVIKERGFNRALKWMSGKICDNTTLLTQMTFIAFIRLYFQEI